MLIVLGIVDRVNASCQRDTRTLTDVRHSVPSGVAKVADEYRDDSLPGADVIED